MGRFGEPSGDDLYGHHVKTTRYGDLYGPGPFLSGWNGTDDSGAPMPAGYYWVEVGFLLGATNGYRALVYLQRP